MTLTIGISQTVDLFSQVCPTPESLRQQGNNLRFAEDGWFRSLDCNVVGGPMAGLVPQGALAKFKVPPRASVTYRLIPRAVDFTAHRCHLRSFKLRSFGFFLAPRRLVRVLEAILAWVTIVLLCFLLPGIQIWVWSFCRLMVSQNALHNTLRIEDKLFDNHMLRSAFVVHSNDPHFRSNDG